MTLGKQGHSPFCPTKNFRSSIVIARLMLLPEKSESAKSR